MLQKRVIPCLLLHKGGLYKTVKFKNPTYIGDPINAIKIFNEKEVDELMFLDIDASASNKEPDFALIEDIASECFMPLCYGGGVKTVEQMKRIYSLGVEKVSLSASAFLLPHLIQEAASRFGRQSVIVTVDVKKELFGSKKVYIHNGKTNTKTSVLEFVRKMEELGAGEIVINSIDRDGMMNGFDLELLSEIKSNTSIPIIGLGGAGNVQHIADVFEKCKLDAVACGSMFVYQGPLRGVLINYPPYSKVQELLSISN